MEFWLLAGEYKIKELGKKPISLPFFPPQIPRGQIWVLTGRPIFRVFFMFSMSLSPRFSESGIL